jgi:hypothetical protein
MTLSRYAAGASFALLLLTFPEFIEAAIAPLSPEEKQERSSHIVTGKVLEINSSVGKSKVEKSFGIHRDRKYKITVLVETVEKGTGVTKGDKILVLAWQPSMRVPPLPGPQGHEGIPKEGDRLTLFLKKLEKQGAFAPLLPNGIETGD